MSTMISTSHVIFAFREWLCHHTLAPDNGMLYLFSSTEPCADIRTLLHHKQIIIICINLSVMNDKVAADVCACILLSVGPLPIYLKTY